MSETVDRNWYSPESQKQQLKAANDALLKMHNLEKEFSEERIRIVEKTDFGIRTRFVKKEG